MDGQDYLELRIPVTDKTKRKIVAIAALTEKNLDEVKEDLATELVDADEFDMFVSSKLHGAITSVDGGIPQNYKFRKSDKSEEPVEDLAGHSLSGDEDEGTVSAEDAVAEGVVPPPIEAAMLPKSASDDDLIDAVLGTPKVSKKTNQRKVRAKISEYTEDVESEPDADLF